MWANPGTRLYSETLVLLCFARWEEVLALPKPDANLKGLTFFWHYARGCAFAAKGEASKADSERKAMGASFNLLPAGLAFGMQYNDWNTIHDLALDTLTAIPDPSTAYGRLSTRR